MIRELSPETDDLPTVDGCPCLRTTPCSRFCTCVNAALSGGCRRCAKYGSPEQQELAAMYIADAIDVADRRFGSRRLRHAIRVTAAAAALVLLAILVAFVVLRVPVAHADPKPGLWQEQGTSVDGVTIRKIRDTTGGDFNVCYVASRISKGIPGTVGADGRDLPVAVAISCLPEARKP